MLTLRIGEIFFQSLLHIQIHLKESYQLRLLFFFSYIGFESVTTLALEMKNPNKDLPIGILGTILITTFLYVGVSLVLNGMVHYSKIDPLSPLSSAFSSVGIPWASLLISVVSLTSLTGNILVCLVSQPRIFYQMSVDGLLVSSFKKVNKKGVPLFSTLFTCGIALFFSIFFGIGALTNMISAGTLSSFLVVCTTVIYVRYKSTKKKVEQYCRFNSPYLERIAKKNISDQKYTIDVIRGHEHSSSFSIKIKI